MEVLKINGITPAAPSKIEVSISDIDSENAGRDTKGIMYRDRIAVKRKLTCSWNALNNREISQLLKAVKGQFFKLSYHDPESGNFETRTFYVGDRTTPVYSLCGGEIIWENISMNFIEQ